MKCEEGGDLGGDSEVRWVIVCETGDSMCAQIERVGWREGILRLAGLSDVGGNERHVNSTFR